MKSRFDANFVSKYDGVVVCEASCKLVSYRLGMETGDLFPAAWSLTSQLFSGKSLPIVEQDFCVYVPQLKALKQMESYNVALLFWSAAVELRGISEQRKFDSVAYDGPISNQIAAVEKAFLFA